MVVKRILLYYGKNRILQREFWSKRCKKGGGESFTIRNYAVCSLANILTGSEYRKLKWAVEWKMVKFLSKLWRLTYKEVTYRNTQERMRGHYWNRFYWIRGIYVIISINSAQDRYYLGALLNVILSLGVPSATEKKLVLQMQFREHDDLYVPPCT